MEDIFRKCYNNELYYRDTVTCITINQVDLIFRYFQFSFKPSKIWGGVVYIPFILKGFLLIVKSLFPIILSNSEVEQFFRYWRRPHYTFVLFAHFSPCSFIPAFLFKFHIIILRVNLTKNFSYPCVDLIVQETIKRLTLRLKFKIKRLVIVSGFIKLSLFFTPSFFDVY